ncbi:MAG: TIGR04282 family arsenosugar biosynthesis glycosyltransferase [Methylobacterium sp.]|jgi:rSAM/selenodomain-associated transferase 1|uniref:TIGR04282 family arsenosugar biosynthesis glycosyltransferase n=1 Tax=Methylobacterium sp. TaxID=409 RepID=UPI0025D4B6E9|nr:TIGR04282 family arsenosugar biosynthesis glycosyltransferase [Methylobacterium sp.]MBX9934689.1 TIGR04282 family arsenosugar biosynthesis glycosyltransferase [Methylobacterium sp.]
MTVPRLVLFTRYPEPGKAKTRLIPALGPDGAAALHRRLAERTVASMRATGLPMEIRSTGAGEDAFLEWLGHDLNVVDQGDGDLGTRLARAASGAPAILLGADTPALTVAHLAALARALSSRPAAVGPAEDGGYWALGIAQPMPFLFEDMPWSTDRVCTITLARLTERGFETAILDTLSDLDRPEDLAQFPDLLA